jgi:ABC-type glutathione transport system ATPase component
MLDSARHLDNTNIGVSSSALVLEDNQLPAGNRLAKRAVNVLTAEHLSCSVGGLKLVDDISMQVRAGEVLAVVRPSGSGKSSFLRLLNRLDEPTSALWLKAASMCVRRLSTRVSHRPKKGK